MHAQALKATAMFVTLVLTTPKMWMHAQAYETAAMHAIPALSQQAQDVDAYLSLRGRWPQQCLLGLTALAAVAVRVCAVAVPGAATALRHVLASASAADAVLAAAAAATLAA